MFHNHIILLLHLIVGKCYFDMFHTWPNKKKNVKILTLKASHLFTEKAPTYSGR